MNIVVEVIIWDNQDSQLLLLHRNNEPKVWSTITGGVEAGEAINTAAFREVYEETGLALPSIYETGETRRIDKGGELFIIHEFFAIVSAPKIMLNEEHSAFEWVDVATMTARIPFVAQSDMITKLIQSYIRNEIEEWKCLHPTSE